jgi:hypothetical protein
MSPIRQSVKDNWALLLLIALTGSGSSGLGTAVVRAVIGEPAPAPAHEAPLSAAATAGQVEKIAAKLEIMDGRLAKVETYVEIQKDREKRPNGGVLP